MHVSLLGQTLMMLLICASCGESNAKPERRLAKAEGARASGASGANEVVFEQQSSLPSELNETETHDLHDVVPSTVSTGSDCSGFALKESAEDGESVSIPGIGNLYSKTPSITDDQNADTETVAANVSASLECEDLNRPAIRISTELQQNCQSCHPSAATIENLLTQLPHSKVVESIVLQTMPPENPQFRQSAPGWALLLGLTYRRDPAFRVEHLPSEVVRTYFLETFVDAPGSRLRAVENGVQSTSMSLTSGSPSVAITGADEESYRAALTEVRLQPRTIETDALFSTETIHRLNRSGSAREWLELRLERGMGLVSLLDQERNEIKRQYVFKPGLNFILLPESTDSSIITVKFMSHDETTQALLQRLIKEN